MTEAELQEYYQLLQRFPRFTPKDPGQETPERMLRRLRVMRSIAEGEDSGFYDELEHLSGDGAWM